jgi:WD40 repeat protein
VICFSPLAAPILSLAVVDRVLYTGSDDRSIRQWEWHSGAQTREYRGHTDGVTDLKATGKSQTPRHQTPRP